MEKFPEIIEAVNGKIPLNRLTEPLLIGFLKKVKNIFEKEPQLINLPKKTIICAGDTHGDFTSSKKVIKTYLKPNNLVIFLGDYVDRAENNEDIRNILYLFHKKLTNKNLILLRGNHEDSITNRKYGFSANVNSVWSERIWKEFNNVFSYMPLAAHTKDIIFLHGGLPEIKDIKEINNIPKNLYTEQNKLLDQILWNDSISDKKTSLFKNHRGVKNAFIYSTPYFNKIMKNIKKKILIRGHDYTAKGYSFNKRCLTLFTSAAYKDYPENNFLSELPLKGILIAIIKKEIIIKDLFSDLH